MVFLGAELTPTQNHPMLTVNDKRSTKVSAVIQLLNGLAALIKLLGVVDM